MMHQISFEPHDALIFLYHRPLQPTYWMKDTPMSLDIGFLGEGGRVLSVVSSAAANSEAPIPGPHETTAVLELPAGQALVAGIQPNTHLVYAMSECKDRP